MPTVAVHIQGISALLQHRFTEDDQNPKPSRANLRTPTTPREEAEKNAYKDNQGQFWFPGAAIARLLREAGGNHKLRGSRKAVKWIVPAAVIVPNEVIIILNKQDKPVKTFEVDSRPVVIPATKGRIMRHRPRWDQWRAKFTLEIDDTVLPVDLIHQLLEEGGRRLGIGDFRPEKGGPFGRFEILQWK